MKQISFRLDYSGGWGSRRKDLWRGFKNACGPYEGPALRYVVAACTAPDGSHWVVQKWRRLLPPFGLRPTFAQRAVELHLSHWSGDLPEFVVKVDWVYKRYDHLYGWLKYKGKGVYGFKATKYGSPLDTWGRNVFVDTYNSRYGRGWKRENGFLTHRGSGAFCYGFYPHGNRPVGKGSRVPRDRDGARRDADPVLAGRGARAVRRQLDEIAYQEQRSCSRTRSAVTGSGGREPHKIAAVAGDELRALMREVPAPVSVVTVDVGGQSAGLTVDSLVSLSLEPPLVGVAVGRHAALHELVARGWRVRAQHPRLRAGAPGAALRARRAADRALDRDRDARSASSGRR